MLKEIDWMEVARHQQYEILEDPDLLLKEKIDKVAKYLKKGNRKIKLIDPLSLESGRYYPFLKNIVGEIVEILSENPMELKQILVEFPSSIDLGIIYSSCNIFHYLPIFIKTTFWNLILLKGEYDG